MKRVLLCVVLVLTSIARSQIQPTTQPVIMKVAPDSTITLTLGNHQVATGKIGMGDVQNLFDPSYKNDLVLGTSTVHGLVVNGNQITYTEAFPQATVDYTIQLQGEDLNVTAKITNNSPKPFNWFSFSLLNFTFSKNPTGKLPSFYWTYLQSQGANLLHPSYQVPLGGAYAQDGVFGIGCSTKSHLTKPSMFQAAFQANGIIPANCQLQFIGYAGVEPLASKTVDFTIRVSANTDWKHLLGNYYATYQSQTGGQQYVSDQRPWSYFASADAVHVTPADPLGFNGDNRRFDLSQGVAAFLHDYGLPVKGVGQGMILWIPQGYNPRGAQYRPDFDCFPATVQANLPALTAGFAAMQERVGLATRPSQLIWPNSWTSDAVTTLDGHNQDQLNALWSRFNSVITQGFNAFYLDSFGMNYNDYLVMKFLRSKLGPNIPTFSEYTNDLISAYSGVYAEITDAGGDTVWMDAQTLQILRWLNPKMSVMCKDPNNIGAAAIYANQMSPLIMDYQFSGFASQLNQLSVQYFSGNQWRN